LTDVYIKANNGYVPDFLFNITLQPELANVKLHNIQ
jgi:hypothetical protein